MEDEPQEKIKILVLGPSKSGKSTLASFLAGTRETPTSKYYPTEPLRILETEIEVEASKLHLDDDPSHATNEKRKQREKRLVFAGGDAKRRRVVVQLWDLGGNVRHQQGWPAVADRADGILFVFNNTVNAQNSNVGSAKELGLWFKHFALDQGEVDEKGNFKRRVGDRHCLVFAHQSAPNEAVNDDDDDDEDNNNNGEKLPPLPKEFEKIKVVRTSLDYFSDNFKAAFDTLMERIVVDKMEEEEEETIRKDRERQTGKAAVL